jgi:hypothetical protein
MTGRVVFYVARRLGMWRAGSVGAYCLAAPYDVWSLMALVRKRRRPKISSGV